MNKEALIKSFKQLYKKEPEEFYISGGRFELLGNHTDHNHGKTLAATCSLVINAAFGKNDKNQVRLLSLNHSQFEFDIKDLSLKEEDMGKSIGLVKGVMYYLKEHGYKIGGFDIYTESTIPTGSGLSSSAAFEILIGQVMNYLYNEKKIPILDICKAGKYAENNYFGKASGLLDQIACASNGVSYIDFENIEKPEITILQEEFKGYHFVVIDTGVSHADMSDVYSSIPSDMYAAAKAMGHKYLREGSKKELDAVKDKITISQYQRALHFYNENERVELAVKSLQNGDIFGVFTQIQKSEQSSRTLLKNAMIGDIYDGSLAQAIDRSNQAMMFKGATKINGGGFAGTVIAIVPDKYYNSYFSTMTSYYGKDHVFPVSVLK